MNKNTHTQIQSNDIYAYSCKNLMQLAIKKNI